MLKKWNIVAIVSKGGGEESANVANFQIYCTKVNFPPAQLLSLHLFLQTIVQFSDPKLSHFKAAARVFFRVNQTKPVVAFSHVNLKKCCSWKKNLHEVMVCCFGACTGIHEWFTLLSNSENYDNFCPQLNDEFI